MQTLTHKALREAINELTQPHRQGQCLEIYNSTATPSTRAEQADWKIRFMPTAGGLQFCWKIVSYRGEGSGYYEPPHRLEEFADFVFTQIQKRAQGGVYAMKAMKHLTYSAALRFVPEHTEHAPFAGDVDDDPIFKDATVITLELPAQ